MRTLLFSCLFISLAVSAQAQYIVLEVKGKVKVNKKEAKENDFLTEDAVFVFNTPNDYVLLMTPNNGKQKVTPKAQKKGGSELMRALSDAIMPSNQRSMAGVRATEPYESNAFADQYDMKGFFRDRLFFTAPTWFQVAASHFPLDSTHYFVIRHTLPDGWVIKRLPQQDQSFELSNEVMQLQGKAFPDNAIQYSELYFVKEGNTDQALGRFNLQFPDAQVIKKELAALYKIVGSMPTEQFLREHAIPYLDLEYGKTQTDTIRQLILQIQQK